jgi:hypothetical protein
MTSIGERIDCSFKNIDEPGLGGEMPATNRLSLGKCIV